MNKEKKKKNGSASGKRKKMKNLNDARRNSQHEAMKVSLINFSRGSSGAECEGIFAAQPEKLKCSLSLLRQAIFIEFEKRIYTIKR